MLEMKTDSSTVECLICHKYYRFLPYHLKRQHNINAKEYQQIFPGAEIICKEMADSIRHTLIGHPSTKKGMILEEFYGKDRAFEIKRLLSIKTKEGMEKSGAGEKISRVQKGRKRGPMKEETKEKIRLKHVEWHKNHPEFAKGFSKRQSEHNCMKNPQTVKNMTEKLWTKEKRIAQSMFVKKDPRGQKWHIAGLKSSKKPSKPQLQLYNIIKKYYPSAQLEYHVITKHGTRHRFIDIAIPDKMMAVEYNGEAWHKDKNADIKRKEELEELGWKVYFFDSAKLKRFASKLEMIKSEN